MGEFKKKIIPSNYFWLSIEGTDAVGKTTLLERIETFLRNQRKINFVIIKEFSDSPFGVLIKKIIKEKKYGKTGLTYLRRIK